MVKLTGKAKAKFLARMKKGRKAALKARGGKKSASGSQSYKYVATDYANGKKFKKGEIEKRIARLEQMIGTTQQGRDTTSPRETRTLGLQGMREERDRLNKEIDAMENDPLNKKNICIECKRESVSLRDGRCAMCD
jgi:uncharacterized coiled-coil DUF342 family protein